MSKLSRTYRSVSTRTQKVYHRREDSFHIRLNLGFFVLDKKSKEVSRRSDETETKEPIDASIDGLQIVDTIAEKCSQQIAAKSLKAECDSSANDPLDAISANADVSTGNDETGRSQEKGV